MRCIILICCCCFLYSCNWRTKYPQRDVDYNKKVWGWKPIYSADIEAKKVTYFNKAQPMLLAGKIYVFGNTIFQNDIGKGIHIIDNTNPATAKRTGFIEIKGNTDIAIKGNYLYANNYNDMVVLDVSNLNALREVKRFKNVFFTKDASKPYLWQAPPDTGYYECNRFYPDSIIVSWVKDSVTQYCRRF
jgi:hypothetical protein